jgi:5'-AMP-activated protein kinase, catalytic alpha subunit
MNGRFTLLGLLGQGNTSKVYKASLVEQPCFYLAVKVIRRSYLDSDPLARESIAHEILALQAVEHPNITRLYDFGDDGIIAYQNGTTKKGLVYLVLEYVEGDLFFNLASAKESPLTLTQRASYFMQLVDSL